MENNYIYRFHPEFIESGSTFFGRLDLGIDVCIRKKIKLVNIRCHSPQVSAGIESKKYVENLMKDREVFCRTFRDRFRKWSTVLAVVYIKNGIDYINLNDILVEKEFASSIREEQNEILDIRN